MQVVGVNHGEIFALQTKQEKGCAEWHAICAMGHTFFYLVSIGMDCVLRGTYFLLVLGGTGGVPRGTTF